MTVTPDETQGYRKSVDTSSLMKQYYSNFFPHTLLYRWLSYCNGTKGVIGDSTFFKRREFCFTLEGDIFVRYRSYQNAEELHHALKTKVPAKFDIGPVYTQDPEKRSAYKGDTAGHGFHAIERELVFDIDLTDYDDVRNTASGTSMSKGCWSLLHVAIQVIDGSLRRDFGFEHILWVYSGRRGIHCWVCDGRARKLTDDQRGAIANYLAVYKGQEKGTPKLSLHPKMLNHPFVEAAYDTLLQHWDKILADQQLLTTQRTRTLVLKIIIGGFLYDSETEDIWEKKLTQAIDSHDSEIEINLALWNMLVSQAQPTNNNGTLWQKALQHAVFACCFPRLDIEVSKKMNHLLKAPFCVHPKTGKVCVPIDVKSSESFDPETVPRLEELVESLKDGSKGSRSTSQLQTATQDFERHFLAPLEQASKEALLSAARKADAHSLQW